MLLPRFDRRARPWNPGYWLQASQLGSRRNAMVAATVLAQRRIERQEAEAFLAARAPALGTVASREAEPRAATR